MKCVRYGCPVEAAPVPVGIVVPWPAEDWRNCQPDAPSIELELALCAADRRDLEQAVSIIEARLIQQRIQSRYGRRSA